MKKYSILTLMLIIQSFFHLLLAQEEGSNQTYVNHTPKSPTVANLGIFGDIPVSLSTGIPNISVPIVSLQEGGLNIPVSIDYHASGIRVSDNSGLVGVKWTINAGGVVSVNHSNQKNNRVVDISSPYVSTISATFINEAVENSYYTQPEGYSYNYSGESGKFYINRSEDVLQVPIRAGVKIERTKINGEVTKFKITDEKGCCYYYGTKEYTDVQTTTYAPYAFGDHVRFVSAYFIDSIVSPQGDRIFYEYENNEYEIKNEHVNSNKYYKADALPDCEKPDEQVVYRSVDYDSKRIKRIYTESNKEVIFNYEDNLLDEKGNKMNDGSGQLSSIIVSAFGKQIKKFELIYNYNGRYNIERIELLDSKENKISDYQFSYVEGTIPNRNTKAVDFFGYYNGQESNESWYPNTPVADLDEANRSVYPEHVKVGMLKGIKYPTGGETYFKYESNEVDRSFQLIGDGEGDVLEPFEYEEFNMLVSGFETETGRQEVVDTFEISDDAFYECIYGTDIAVELEAVGTNTGVDETAQEEGLGCEGRILIEGPITIVYDKHHPHGQTQDGFSFRENSCLPKGKYTVTMTTKFKSDELYLRLKWKVKAAAEGGTGNIFAGGLRVKEVKNILENGKEEVKTYTYRNGMLCNAPKYFAPHAYSMCYYIGNSLWKVNQQCKFYTYSTSPVRSIGTTNGSYASYQFVEEDMHGNGWVESEFTNTNDELELESVTAPITSLSHERGKLKTKKTYANIDGAKSLIKLEELFYSVKDKENWFGMLGQRGWGLQNKFSMLNQLYSYEFLKIYSSRICLDSIIVSEFNKQAAAIVSKQEFKYENPYNLRTETILKTSNQKQKTQKIKYPSETTGENSFSNHFLSQHMLAYPVEVEDYTDGTKISGILNHYTLFGKKGHKAV